MSGQVSLRVAGLVLLLTSLAAAETPNRMVLHCAARIGRFFVRCSMPTTVLGYRTLMMPAPTAAVGDGR